MEDEIGTVFVANLPWATTEDDLEALFSQHMTVLDVRIIQDMGTGRSLGYGFVELEGAEAVERAISCLNGSDFCGRQILVKRAQPRQPRRARSSGNAGIPPAPCSPPQHSDE